jgi:ferredoxin
MKVRVYLDRCIGAADCVRSAPQLFQLDSRGKAQVVEPAGADPAVLLEAAESCPTNAIFLFDDTGRRVYPPEKE